MSNVTLIKSLSELPNVFAGLSGAKLEAKVAESGDIMFEFYNYHGKKMFCKFDKWQEGKWLVLAGKGIWFWHKPDISYFRDKSLQEGFIPYKTRYTDKTAQEYIDTEVSDGYIRKNVSITESPNNKEEFLITIPGLDNQKLITFNPLHASAGNFPQTFILFTHHPITKKQ